MTKNEVMEQLQKLGNESTKKVLIKHGAKEPFFGVKVADLKIIQKKVKKDHKLALELFATGNSDAMYLAGLIADEQKITKKELQTWVKGAYWYLLSEYTVAWIAAESNYGYELAMEWIGSDQENIASSGWATLSSLMSIKPDNDLKLPEVKKLLDRVTKEIKTAPNRVRYTMNGFVIAAGAFISSMTETAKIAAAQIGKISVDMGGTACKVPYALDYIKKVEQKNRIGKKKKMARC